MNGKLKLLCAILLSFACLLQSPAHAESDGILSLYLLAKAKDPVTGRAQARLDAGKADENISLSQMLPRIEATAAVNWISNETLYYAPSNISGSYMGDNYGFSARLPLLQIPNIYNLAASKASVRAADAVLSGSRQDLIVTLVEAYFGLLKAQVDETLYKDEVKRLAQIYDQALEFKNSGTGTIISVFEAKAKLDSAASDGIKATIMRKLAAQQLENIVGVQVGEIKDLGAYKAQLPDPPDIGWWIAAMQKNRPGLIQAIELLSQSELQRKALSAGHLPTISVSGGYSVNKGSTFLPEVETRQWLIGFNMTLPIYSGGEISARRERAVALESEQRFNLSETRDQGIQKLKQAFLNLEYTNEILPSLLQKKFSAEMQLEATKDGRSVGIKTGIDLVNAEQGVAIAQRDLKSALLDNALRYLQLKGAAGILAEKDLVELNNLLVNTTSRELFLNRQSSEAVK